MRAAIVFAALLLLAVEASGQPAPRTAWGHPDLRGTWTNVTATPLERPRDLAGQSVLTEDERAERFRQFTLETTTDTVPRAGSTSSLCGERVKAVTSWPRSSAIRQTCCPVLPVAPEDDQLHGSALSLSIGRCVVRRGSLRRLPMARRGTLAQADAGPSRPPYCRS